MFLCIVKGHLTVKQTAGGFQGNHVNDKKFIEGRRDREEWKIDLATFYSAG